MTYIFIFLGEFGYELFNWQGRVRRFSHMKNETDKIVCCSRANLYPLYESADMYVDISSVPEFKQSVASMYLCNHPDACENFSADSSGINFVFLQEVKAAIKSFVCAELRSKMPGFDEGQARFVFSSDRNVVSGVNFGLDQDDFATDKDFDIYGKHGLHDNQYEVINYSDNAIRKKIEAELHFDLNKKYILVQNRQRSIVVRSKDSVDVEKFLQLVSKDTIVIFINFDTQRKYDSYSACEQNNIDNILYYTCTSFPEQITLIKHAFRNVFFTTGDFGSHIYIPPFLGKDVYAVAPASVYGLGTTPIDFWNEFVFTFGGKIKPIVSNEVFSTDDALQQFADAMQSDVPSDEYLQRVSFKDDSEKDKHLFLKCFLAKIENIGHHEKFDSLYLWPRTPMTPHHQDKILERVGATDYDINNPRSRSHSIVMQLQKFIAQGMLDADFNAVDLCCGDAIVLGMVKSSFPEAFCAGVDCLKGKFETHKMVINNGVDLYYGYLQNFLDHAPDKKIDVLLMLNTYRGWSSADLREDEKDTPVKFDDWVIKNVKYTVVTATVEQIYMLKKQGKNVKIIGPGEDNSHMIVIMS